MARRVNTGEEEAPDTNRRKVTRTLKVVLTEAEMLQLGKDQARSRQMLGESKDRKDEVNAQFKAEIEGHETTQNRLASLINNGYEYRDVECELIEDYKAGSVSVVRLDTGEEVDTRPMTDSERQRTLLPPADGAQEQPSA